jgi:hypothetical protein
MSKYRAETAALATELRRQLQAEASSHKFNLGHIVTTPGALEQLSTTDVVTAICRHAKGDWGDVCEHDRNENEFALDKYLRLFSVYRSQTDIKFWVITEADRSVTTVLLPSEY